MKVCACFLLFAIFALPSSAAQPPGKDKKSISLSLQTVLDFDDQDKKDNNIVDIVQNFMQKVNNALDKNKNKQQTVIRKFREAKDNTFTDFLQEAIDILNSYEDEDFEEFFEVLNDEIKEYHYRGCKFYELTDNLDTRRLLDAKLDLIKGKSIAVTKAHVNALAFILKDELYDDNVKEFVDHVNSLYKDDSKKKFQKVLTELQQYRSKSKRNGNSLVTIVRDGLRSVIFDHYTNLHTKTRRDLKSKIEKFWSKFKNPHSIDDKTNEDNDTNETKNKVKTFKNKGITNKDDDLDKKHKTNKELSSSDESRSITDASTVKTVKKGDKKLIDHLASSVSSEKIPSSETFDSNSIEFSLERQQQYNTQRYVTLYTESITLPPKNTTKKAKKIDKKGKSKSRSQKKKKYRSEHKQKQTTQPEAQFDRHETQMPPDLRMKKEDNLKQKKYDTARSMPTNNAQLFREYDTNLKSEENKRREINRRLDPMEDTDVGSDIAPDSAEAKNPRKLITTKPRKHPQMLRLEAVFEAKPTEETPADDTGTSPRDQNYGDLRRDNSLPQSSHEGLSIEMFKRERDGEILRRSGNNTTNLNPAEIIFLRKINDLEKEINEVKNKIEGSDDKLNITNVNKRNITEKTNTEDDIVKLVDSNHDTTKRKGKKNNKIDKGTSKSETGATISASIVVDLASEDTHNTSKDGRRNIPHINSANITNNTEAVFVAGNTDKNDTKTSTANVTTVKNEIKSGKKRRELAFSSPPKNANFDIIDDKQNGIVDGFYDEKKPSIKNKGRIDKYRRYNDLKGSLRT